MIVDSGADISFIPLEIDEIFELKPSDKKESRSASGPFEKASSTVRALIVLFHNY